MASPTGRVTAVCVVHEIAHDPAGDPDTTAIDKRPVDGPVEAAALGLAGDTQVDTRHHGGVEQAVYAYADEDAAWWAAELDRGIAPGLFGENLRTSGIDVTGAEIGERWQVGEAGTGPLLEVTSPRIPCMTFAYRMAEPRWVKRFTDHGACGAYLRVVAPGVLRAGDPVDVVRRPGHGVTIGHLFPDLAPDAARTLLDAADVGVVDLGPKVLQHVRQAAGRA